MKRLAIAAIMIALLMGAYSCATKCVTEPPPGGFSYDEPAGGGQDGTGK